MIHTLRLCPQGPREQLAILAQTTAGAHVAAVGLVRGRQRHLDGVPQRGSVSGKLKACELQQQKDFKYGRGRSRLRANSGSASFEVHIGNAARTVPVH